MRHSEKTESHVHKINSTLQSEYLLNEQQTLAFIDEIREACLLVEMDRLVGVVKDYGLDQYDGVGNYMMTVNLIEKQLQTSDHTIFIKNVEPFNSRCNFCEVGRQVQAYRVTYAKPLSGIDGPCVIYQCEFAYRIETKDNRLIHFGFCNAFEKVSHPPFFS